MTAVAGTATYFLMGWLVRLAAGGEPALIWLLAGAYAALGTGFLVTALLARLAPKGRYLVAVALVFVMVGIAGALIFGLSGETGPIPASLLGTSLVVGAFGYALRVRGFSEAISGREL
jgi:hypothetical protein